jgi:hypothetical protein
MITDHRVRYGRVLRRAITPPAIRQSATRHAHRAANVGARGGYRFIDPNRRRCLMPSKSANVKNEKQYEALKDKGMSKERAAKIANAKDSSKHGGQQSGKGGDSSQGGTTVQKKKAGRKGGKASH